MSQFKSERVPKLPFLYSKSIALVQLCMRRLHLKIVQIVQSRTQKYLLRTTTNLRLLYMFGCVQHRRIFFGYVLKIFAQL
ncbi:unnamed protein product [Albugo candida]|uniref:Uncharacterized protein n=1 Tax=Albugo candida TaxID=65357 RepID=A0A024FUW7_9STRA|nr:unnamed protein product [Albugo candida]|eukprot:CCI10836.1 unnamed protein product [Albugo candida]